MERQRRWGLLARLHACKSKVELVRIHTYTVKTLRTITKGMMHVREPC
jgi:hypothetical protein